MLLVSVETVRLINLRPLDDRSDFWSIVLVLHDRILDL
jgi:hypothetical protein